MKGIIGKKVGMSQVFDADGKVTPVTVIQAGPCFVTQIRTAERDDCCLASAGIGWLYE